MVSEKWIKEARGSLYLSAPLGCFLYTPFAQTTKEPIAPPHVFQLSQQKTAPACLAKDSRSPYKNTKTSKKRKPAATDTPTFGHKTIEQDRINGILKIWLPNNGKIMEPDTYTNGTVTETTSISDSEDSAKYSNSAQPVGDEEKIRELSEALGTAVIQEILKKAPENLETLLIELKQGIAGSDIEIVRRSAHTIKGTADSVGAIKIVAIAANIEAIAEDLDAAQNGIPDLEEAAAETITWWNELAQKYKIA